MTSNNITPSLQQSAKSKNKTPSAFSTRVAEDKNAPKSIKSDTGFHYSTASAPPIRPSFISTSQIPMPFQLNTTYSELTETL
jgi:hypothetical protein